jgi:CTP:molybdopterin cytidylyltransferase MocA
LRLADVQNIVVVLGHHAQKIAEEINCCGVSTAVNPNPAAGQLSSVIVGVEASERFAADAILLCPVDHPLISPATVKGLLDEFARTDARIVAPLCKGKRGHPVLFASSLFGQLKSAPRDVGARAVVWAHPREVAQVETADEGVLRNVNTAADYEYLPRDLRGIA